MNTQNDKLIRCRFSGFRRARVIAAIFRLQIVNEQVFRFGAGQILSVGSRARTRHFPARQLIVELLRSVRFPVERPTYGRRRSDNATGQFNARSPRQHQAASERAHGRQIGWIERKEFVHRLGAPFAPPWGVACCLLALTFNTVREAKGFRLFADASAVGGRHPDLVERRDGQSETVEVVVSLRRGHRVALRSVAPGRSWRAVPSRSAAAKAIPSQN